MTVTVKGGDYGVVDTAGIIDGLIRFGDVGSFNHAFTFLVDTEIDKVGGKWTVISGGDLAEAGGHGMVDGDIAYYLEHARHLAVSKDPLTDAQRQQIVLEAKYEVGTKVPYGYGDIALLGLARLGIKWKWLHRRLAKAHLLICSQAVAHQYHKAGVDTMPGHADIDVTPETLALRSGVVTVF